MDHRNRFALRAPGGALVAAALALLAASGAHAATQWTYPLLPHVKALAFFPDPMTDASPVEVVLSSTYDAGQCWTPTNVIALDSAHVEVDLAACTATPDSVSSWVRELSLGLFHAGSHSLTIHAVVQGLPDESITVPFDVIAYVPPPPAPPDSGGPTRIAYITTSPEQPTITDVVHVEVTGNVDFGCAQFSNVRVTPDTLAVTLAPSITCADTAQMWRQGFDVGPLAAGPHVYQVAVTVLEPTRGLVTLRSAVGFTVTDPNAPPPPAPPDDSLRTVLGPTHPNPFRVSTTFSVSLDRPTPARVEVYDLGGRRVATVQSGLLPAGTTQLEWNGRRADGSRASGGIYFYRLVLPARTVTRRVVLLGTS